MYKHSVNLCKVIRTDEDDAAAAADTLVVDDPQDHVSPETRSTILFLLAPMFRVPHQLGGIDRSSFKKSTVLFTKAMSLPVERQNLLPFPWYLANDKIKFSKKIRMILLCKLLTSEDLHLTNRKQKLHCILNMLRTHEATTDWPSRK